MIITYPNSAFIDFISELHGIPVSCSTRYSWLVVQLPGNNGFFNSISARIHPILHISASVPYELEPSNIYGARYQRVATPSVKAWHDNN